MSPQPAPYNTMIGAVVGALVAGGLIALFGPAAGLLLSVPFALGAGFAADLLIFIFAELEVERQATRLEDLRREQLP